MSNRNKKAKTAALSSAVGGKNSPHITKITASSGSRGNHQSSPHASNNSAQPTTPRELRADGAKVENIINDEGKVETRPIANPELNKPNKLTRAERKAAKLATKKSGEERPIKNYFILVRPFIRLGRYLRDSWREIRQVRWPNRKATWKMTLAVLVYVALFMIFLTLIDMLFTFIFDLLFKQ